MAERKRFDEEINARLHEMFGQLIEEFPELDGAAVALLYAPELTGVPAHLAFGDLQDPSIVCRLGATAAELPGVLGRGLSQFFRAAEEAVRARQSDNRDENAHSGKEAQEAPASRTGQFGRPPRPPEDN